MNIKEHYDTKVIPEMREKFGFKNRMAVPRIIKIVLNVGVSSKLKDSKVQETIKDTLKTVSGQNAVARTAKKSVSNFKIRQGQTVGFMVTLRGNRMYDFLEKLIKLTFPRMRDFRGLRSTSFDARGNFTIGLRESSAFPEIKAGDMERQHGLEITVVTNASNREQGFELLRLMGFPFVK
ncbi:MAG: 50S ribosomal protein L5 [bacterium]|nr:50S ribosomal protein L5 [bacterium]